MLFSRALIPTLKEAPQDATNASYTWLMRGGYIRRVGAGVYDFLPLGLRVLRKVEATVRREMDKAGALEILMPALLPAEFFKETGRYDRFGDNLFRLKDRKGAEMHLGPTHEEIVTDIARREIRSYRDMPKNLYQVQAKFRDEPRPRGGLLRCREFVMKDAYSFDATEEGAKQSYEKMRQAYCNIYDHLRLNYRMVAADAGAMGGSTSAEFQVLADSGEDAIVACDTCSYAANVEVAGVRAPVAAASAQPMSALEKLDTPKVKSIAQLCAFLSIEPAKTLKSLVYAAPSGALALVVLRGDHEANPVAVARGMGVDEAFLADETQVKEATGTYSGFVGPVGFKGKLLVDRAAAALVDGVAGGNEKDVHLRGVNHGRDYAGEVGDLRMAANGDGCPNCEAGTLATYKGIEAGHIFILGTHYSAQMGATYLSETQETKPIVMGCYGIGVSRLVAAAIEQNHDADGILWPMTLAPYQVHLCTLGAEQAVMDASRALYEELTALGVEVLWDDRDERPGVKFKDADLLGMPLRLTLGAKGLAAGQVELKARSEKDAKKAELIALAGAAADIAARVRAAMA